VRSRTSRYNAVVQASGGLRKSSPAVIALLFASAWLAGAGAMRASEIEPLLLLVRQEGTEAGASANSLQIYRIPLAATLLAVGDRPWGLDLTFPVSLGFYDLNTASSVGDVVSRVSTVSVAPGVEFLVPVSQRWRLKPYGEVSLGMTTSGETTEVQYAAGVRARGGYRNGPYQLAAGLGAHYASTRASHLDVSDYTTLELGLDFQRSLGFRLAGREASGGVYGIGRWFPDLRIEGAGDRILDVQRVLEVGLSFSTAPEMSLLGIKLPWIALGYRFGDMFQGIRLSFSFPF
jgi:hypothetical protein